MSDNGNALVDGRSAGRRLSDGDVAAIRALPHVSSYDLGDHFGVDAAYIRRIRRGVARAGAEPPPEPERTARSRLRWTLPEAVAALHAYVEREGRVPRTSDLTVANGLPAQSSIRELTGGTWADFVEEQGYPRPRRGCKPGATRPHPAAPGRTGPSSTSAPHRSTRVEPRAIGLVGAASVRPVRLPLLWRERIPAATLSVIAGKPGLGKSTLSTTIAAELSQRGLTVILSNLEDDAAGVLRPRLDVAGAELEHVLIVPRSEAPVLPDELPALRALVERSGASCLILDPIAGHFKSDRAVHERAGLRGLLELAASCRCAVIGIHHTVKSTIDGTALGAVGGPASGLGGAARSVYLYGYDPADEDRRALAYAKGNGFEAPPALLIEHETVEYECEGEVVEAGRLLICEESNIDAKQVLRRGKTHKRRDADAAEWLTLFLAAAEDCRRSVSELREEGRKAGFGWQTLLRVRTALELERLKLGFGADGFWAWRLPDRHPLRQEVQAA